MNEWIAKWYEAHADEVTALSDDIWAHPELSMQEYHACRVTASQLRDWGFSVRTFRVGTAQEDNAIEATWGSGKPVIGFVGEYDALENLGQEAVPYESPIPGPGHGCGHNLMGAGVSSAAAALCAAMEHEGLSGTVKYFATPAEEKFGGKLLMDADGLFDDLDVCLNWHPGPKPNGITEETFIACGEWRFSFTGKAAHAAGQPWNGRSALDACELMNVGVQYLREHVKKDVSIHYAYDIDRMPTNVVPAQAATIYSIRSGDTAGYREVAERVCRIAEGAAMMTGTEVTCAERSYMPETVVNRTLNEALYTAVKKVPEIEYTDEEMAFAYEVYKNTHGSVPKDAVLLDPVMPPLTGQETLFPGSTDLGVISQHVPTVTFFCYGDVIDTIGHHWSQVACSGMSIGHKGELFAGKCLAQCGLDLLQNPSVIARSREELEARA